METDAGGNFLVAVAICSHLPGRGGSEGRIGGGETLPEPGTTSSSHFILVGQSRMDQPLAVTGGTPYDT